MEKEHNFLMDKNLIKLQITESENVVTRFKEDLIKNPFKSYLSYQAIDEIIDIKGKKAPTKIQNKTKAKEEAKKNRREQKTIKDTNKMLPVCT